MTWSVDIGAWVDKPSFIQAFSDDGEEQDYLPERTCGFDMVTIDHGSRSWGIKCTLCQCEFEHQSGRTWNYCPNCGSRVIP